MVTHEEILAVLEELAPRVCAETGDESHFEIRPGETCSRLGVCLEPTERRLYLAASDGVDFVITHHPWNGEAAEVIRAKGISIYRLHSAWDLAPDGNMVTLARMVGLRDWCSGTTCSRGHDLSLQEMLERCQRIVGRASCPTAGIGGRVTTVGIIPGSGFLPIFRRRWEALVQAGCDTIISGEISHSSARFAQCRDPLDGPRPQRPGQAGHGPSRLLLRRRLLGAGCEVEFYDDFYAINYYTAWSLPRQEEGRETGIVLPFPG